MWPFTRKSIKATTISAACDGKHHQFSPWMNILLYGAVQIDGVEHPRTFKTTAQQRTCVACNYTERRRLR